MLCCVCCLFGFYILGSQHTLSRLASIKSEETLATTQFKFNSKRSSINSNQLASSTGYTNEESKSKPGHDQSDHDHNHKHKHVNKPIIISNASQESETVDNDNNNIEDNSLPELTLKDPPNSEYTNPMTFSEYEEYIKTRYMELQKLKKRQLQQKSSNRHQHRHQQQHTDTSELLSAPIPEQLPSQSNSGSKSLPQPPTIKLKSNLNLNDVASSSDEENIFIRYADSDPEDDGNKLPLTVTTPNHMRSRHHSSINDISKVIIKLSTSDPVDRKNSNEHSLELGNNSTFRDRRSRHSRNNEGNSMDSIVENKQDNGDKPEADVWSAHGSENRDKFAIETDNIMTTPWRGELSQNYQSPSTINLHPHIYEKSVLRPKLPDMTSGSSLPTLPASHNNGKTEEKLDTMTGDGDEDKESLNGRTNHLSLDSILPGPTNNMTKMHSEISADSPQRETAVKTAALSVFTGYSVQLDQEPSSMGLHPPQCTYVSVQHSRQASQSYPTCFIE